MPTATPSAGLGKIAFVSDRDGNSEIYSMEADGSQQKRLTYSGSGNVSFNPTWSPDGQQIAFISGDDEISHCDNGGQIYVMNADGTNRHRLSHDNFCDYNPAWSPDGKHIAFISASDHDICMPLGCVYEMNSDGTNPQFLVAKGDSRDPDYSPDDKSLVFYAWDGGLSYILLLKFTPDHRVASTEALTDDDVNVERQDSNPAWSPDGRSIAFISSNRLDTCTIQFCLSLMNPANKQSRQFPLPANVVPVPQENQHLSWSSDGKYLAFVGTTNGEDKLGIWITDINGNNVKRLTPEQSTDIEPSWQPVKLPQRGAP